MLYVVTRSLSLRDRKEGVAAWPVRRRSNPTFIGSFPACATRAGEALARFDAPSLSVV